MNCADVQAKVHSYVDAELDKASRIDVDEHLQTCASCAAVFAEQQSLISFLKQRAPDFHESAQLRARIESSLPASRSTNRFGSIPQPNWSSFAAAICLILALSWALNMHQRVVDFEDGITEDAVAVHQRSLLENHLVDVHSTDAAELQTLSVAGSITFIRSLWRRWYIAKATISSTS
jgi:anti-sigma factor RsiW